MTKEEFTDRVKAINGQDVTVSDEDYKIIEYVYNFYPTISETNGKFQIATIYVYGGMAVILDMVSRARRAQELESEIRNKRESLNQSIDMYNSLKKCDPFYFLNDEA